MAEVKNYGLSGVHRTLQLGKQGPVLVGNADTDSFTVTLQDASTLTTMGGANASSPEHFVTKAQLDTVYTEAQFLANVNYNSSSPISLGTISSGTKTIITTFEVDTIFNGNAVVTVGTSGDNSLLMSDNYAEIEVAGSYQTINVLEFPSNTALNIYVTQGGATQGAGNILVSVVDGPVVNGTTGGGGGGSGIALTDLSVTSNSPSGNGSLTYNNSTGVFTFTPADTTGGAVLGNIISNTDGSSTYSVSVGTDGVVTMTTARGGLEFGALPEPGGPTHLHIMRPAGQEGSSDLFFGDDFNYVKLTGRYGPGSEGVDIGSSYNGGAVSTWRFGSDGHLIPGTDNLQDIGTPTARIRHIYVGPGSITVGNSMISESTTGKLVLPGVTRATTLFADEIDESGEQSYSFNSAPSVIIDAYAFSVYSGAQADPDYVAAQYSVDQIDDDGEIDGITIDAGGTWTQTIATYNRANDMYAYVGSDPDPTANFVAGDWEQIPFRVRAKANDVEYEFEGGGSTGNFVFDGSVLEMSDDAEDMTLRAPDDLYLDALGDDVYIRADDDIRLRAGVNFDEDTYTYAWNFDNDGHLNFLNDASDGSHGRISMPIDEATDERILEISGYDQVHITSNTGNTDKTWKFDTNGNLILPADGDILDSNGDSVLGGGSGGGGTGLPPYKGFRAHYGRMWGNSDDPNGPINKIVIYKDSVTPSSTIDVSTENDDFTVTGLSGSDVVAMLVVIGEDIDQTPTTELKTFTESIIDNVILDEGVEGDINSINAMKTAFYDNFNTFSATITDRKANFNFFSVNNQFSISPQYTTGDGAGFSSISYNMNNDTLDLGSWGQGAPNTHEVNDVHVIPGNTIQDPDGNFLQTPANDVTVTITGVSSGAILSYTVTGSLPRPSVIWPGYEIDDGGDDEYDNGNRINTNLDTNISYNSGNVVTNSSAFGGGEYVVTYQDSIFGVFATNAAINSISTDGGSGFDGDGQADTGSLYGDAGGESPVIATWTNPNDNVWRIETYNGGAAVSYNGDDYDAKWFDIANHSSGDSNFRGAIIQYHAYVNNEGVIIGTIHLGNDHTQDRATHTEHLSGSDDLQFVTLWECNSERGRLYFKMTNGNSEDVMIQWTATIFYGQENDC